MACTPFLPGVQTSTEYCLLTSLVPTRVIIVANERYLQPRRSAVVRRPSLLIVTVFIAPSAGMPALRRSRAWQAVGCWWPSSHSCCA
jgi:hypothetical protein